ncbi:unnamed protein product [Closterium sp. Naga37s-1]|nr:unnamed protein product [Closterium sp. Naga37s-1]
MGVTSENPQKSPSHPFPSLPNSRSPLSLPTLAPCASWLLSHDDVILGIPSGITGAALEQHCPSHTDGGAGVAGVVRGVPLEGPPGDGEEGWAEGAEREAEGGAAGEAEGGAEGEAEAGAEAGAKGAEDAGAEAEGSAVSERGASEAGAAACSSARRP